MSESADDLIFQILGQQRALPGISARQAVEEGVRALAAETLPVLDAQDVCFRIRRALETGRPLSLIRLGDGEALSLAQGLVLTPEETLARGPFLPSHGVPVPDDATRQALLGAVRTADLVGVPLSRSPNYQPLFTECLTVADVHLDPNRVTHSLVNYELWKMGLLEPLLRNRRVLVVGGPAVAFAEVLRAHGALVAGVIAPVTGMRGVDSAVQRSLQHEFDIALVSAGVAACVICPRISRAVSKVALDFGACADEIVHGEPWREAPAGVLVSGGDLRRMFAAVEGGPFPEDVGWEAEELRRAGLAATVRYTARWDRRGSFGRRSFIVKTGRDAGRLAWEAGVLGAVQPAQAFAVPAVHLCDPDMLAMSDLGGQPLTGAARPWWRAAARTLAAFHTRSRLMVRALPPSRRFEWAAARRPLGQAMEGVRDSAHALPAAGRELYNELETAWIRYGAQTPVGSDLVLAHGDLRPEHVLAPDALGAPVGVVGWAQACEHLPALDLAALAARLPAGTRRLLLDDYIRGREANGWPCVWADLAHDFAVLARMRLMDALAGALQRQDLEEGTRLAHTLREMTSPTAE